MRYTDRHETTSKDAKANRVHNSLSNSKDHWVDVE